MYKKDSGAVLEILRHAVKNGKHFYHYMLRFGCSAALLYYCYCAVLFRFLFSDSFPRLNNEIDFSERTGVYYFQCFAYFYISMGKERTQEREKC